MHQAFSLKLHTFLSPPILTHSCYIIFELFFVHRRKDLCLDNRTMSKNWSHPSQPDWLHIADVIFLLKIESINQSINQSIVPVHVHSYLNSATVLQSDSVSSVGWSMADHLPDHEFEFLPDSLPLFPILTFLSQ